MGFDTMATNLVLRSQKMGQKIKLLFILPCKSQDEFWIPSAKENYAKLLSKADAIEYISGAYFDGCMEKRNRRMIELSDMCIAYFRKERSGTAQTVRMAKEKKISVIFL